MKIELLLPLIGVFAGVMLGAVEDLGIHRAQSVIVNPAAQGPSKLLSCEGDLCDVRKEFPTKRECAQQMRLLNELELKASSKTRWTCLAIL